MSTLTTPAPKISADMRGKKPVMEVRNLRIHYDTPKGAVIAVAGVSFDLYEGETLGLVGESGCGKSTTAYGILQLINPPGRIVEGSIMLEGKDLLKLSEREFRKLRRGRDRNARGQTKQSRVEKENFRPLQNGWVARSYLRYVPARTLRRDEAARLYCDGDCA
jgi:ABC-type oligopeptide transport system ATPase subunit